MTTLAPPALPSAPSPPVSNARRQPRYFIWGTVLIVIVFTVVVLILFTFGGTFTNYVVVTAQLPASSTAAALNSPVEYRNVTVGDVASSGRSVPGGLVLVTLHMRPSRMKDIPAGVQATVTPVSFFGNEYIVLQPPANPGTQTLQAGQIIPPLSSGVTASLQDTLNSFDHLLIELHPGQLDAALTAIASALQGQGTSLGQNFVRTNTYLKDMLPLWPTVVADFEKLVPVANGFAEATPNIIQILSNQAASSQVATGDATNLRDALMGGATLATDSAQLFEAIEQPFIVLAADSGPFLQDLSQNPHQISELLSGFNTWAQAWLSAEGIEPDGRPVPGHGPYLNVTATVRVVNPADLALAVLGGTNLATDLADGLGSSFVNAPTYTSADCPRFGSLSGCGGATTDAATSSSAMAAQLVSDLSSASSVLPEPAQTAAVSQIVAGATGRQSADPAVSTLLLSPVLEGLASGS
jgi:virulence factor Mce-like protein